MLGAKLEITLGVLYTYHTVLYPKLLTNISCALYPFAGFQVTKKKYTVFHC